MSFLGNLGVTQDTTSGTSAVITLTRAAAAGTSIRGGVVLQFSGTAPTGLSVTDNKGNAYTIDKQDLPNTGCALFRCQQVATGKDLAIGDQITISWTNTATQKDAIADSFSGASFPDGIGTWDLTHLSAATQTISATAAAVPAGDDAYCLFASFGGQSNSTTTIDAPFSRNAYAATSGRVLISGYAIGVDGSNLTATAHWPASHTCTGIVAKYAQSNVTPPVANAGLDQTVAAGAQVVLDGSASTGDGISLAWTHVSGPSSVADLSDPTLAKPKYTPKTSGVDVWKLTVTDVRSTTANDTVSVTATNRAPTALINGPTQVAIGQTVVLDGSGSSDPDAGDTLTYAWTGLSGPNVNGIQGAASSFSYAANSAGTDVVQLVVTDNHGQASTAVTISVTCGAAGVRIRVNDTWVAAKVKLRSGGAWVDV